MTEGKALVLMLWLVAMWLCAISHVLRRIVARLRSMDDRLSWHAARSEAAMGRLRPLNPHAHLLGQVVEARLYEGSDWERYIVVGVGWRGSLCIRRVADPHGRGWWVKHSVLTADRFREVET